MQLNDLQFTLEELNYFPTRSQNAVPLRPYVFNTVDSAIEAVGRRMEETGSTKITPAMLNGLTAGIVQPSAVGHDSVINHSWISTRRFLFMLKVGHVDHMGVEIKTYIFGYTEHDGITDGGDIDLEMAHFINNVIETVAYTVPTPLGPRRIEKLFNVYNAIYSSGGADVFTQRPVDMYQNIVSSEMAQFMPTGVQVNNVGNMVTPFSNNVVTSTTENNITTEYLAKILTSGLQAVKTREIHINSYQIGSDDPAERFFTEPSISDCVFLRTLSRVGGSRITRPMFVFRNLMQMDNTIYQRFNKYNLTSDFTDPILTRTPEKGEEWYGQDTVTVKAFSLIENSVALASKYGFTSMNFVVTNMTDMTGIITFEILGFNSFMQLSKEDFSYLLDLFETKFKTEIFLNETNAGRVPLYAEIYVNLLGTSKIMIEYSGFQATWFTVPTYASSHYSSVVSTDQSAVDHSASELSKALNTLTESQTPVYY